MDKPQEMRLKGHQGQTYSLLSVTGTGLEHREGEVLRAQYVLCIRGRPLVLGGDMGDGVVETPNSSCAP